LLSKNRYKHLFVIVVNYSFLHTKKIKMANSYKVSDVILQMSKNVLDHGIFLLYTDNQIINSNQISIKNRTLTNFGSCSYLGLEFDHRLIASSKNTIDKYGTQFSESRIYVSVNAYEELEEKLETIFDAPVVITPTTTLGHFSNLPVLINPITDAIIVDHQVHNSVQMAVQMLKGSGTYVELLRHNRMDLLEQRIVILKNKYKHIWYMADGVYSMFGDKAPMKELEKLLNTYEQFRLYVDDAHGMSVYGKHGRGYVLNEIKMHPHMVMGTSLNKAFASGGGVMVYPNKEMANKIRMCGGPMITSGPIQPAMLGAALASASIHLSDEIIDLQNDLQDNIKFARTLLAKTNLPVITQTNSPVMFVGVALPKVGYNLVQRLMNEGFYVNLGMFPAVPMKNTGIRFTITRLHTFTQIAAMVKALEYHWPLALQEEGISVEEVYSSFKLPNPEEIQVEQKIQSLLNQTLELTVIHNKSIRAMNRKEWDTCFIGQGNFDYDGMLHLEQSFMNNTQEINNWLFDYFTIKDREGKIVLSTFTTCATQKDDMLSTAGVSAHIEELRVTNPLYLTSKTLLTGSFITEGNHIYYDETHALYKEAFLLLFDKLSALQEKYTANSVVLRDFINIAPNMEKFFIDNGFFKVAVPDGHTIDLTTWQTEADFVNQMNAKNRYHFKTDIEKNLDQVKVEVITKINKDDLAQYYKMYLDVKERNLFINTFDIPLEFFENMFANDNTNWELLKISTMRKGKHEVAAVVFCYKSNSTYIPLIIGMNYDFIEELKIYKVSLYMMMKRAKAVGCTKMNLGFGASLEKRKLGAQVNKATMFIQIKDSFNNAVIEEMITQTNFNKNIA
jgi:7-keto-8-aminopelargonate synthetase-like enzyme